MDEGRGKKILLVITKSNWGGAQRYVYDLATNLPHSFECAVALGGNGLLKERLEKKGIQVVRIPHLERDISLAKEFRAFYFLLRHLRKNHYDTVHLNSSKAGGLGVLAARLAGVSPIIFTAHGWPFYEDRNVFSRALIKFLSWLTIIFAHATITVCERDYRAFDRWPFIKGKMVKIYNGIDSPVPLGSANVIRNSFPKGVRITGTIGQLTRNKNQIALIEQAKNDPALYIAIVGDGEDRLYLMNKIKEYGLGTRVKLFGFMPASEVLRGFDVFALPSLKEGLPYVLLEAKAAGLPIVANRVGGVGEILDAENMDNFSLEQMVQKTSALYC